MGAGSSKALSTTYEADRKEVLAKTGDTRFICDKILNYMLKDINISDFLLLADKRECNRYVIFLANTIDQRFRSISIVPSKGPGGKLYFKPGKEVVEPKPEEVKERQSLCIFLAYFYVRIFQILGAIMLTVIDDIEVHIKSGDMRKLMEDEARQGNPALYAPLAAPGLPYRYGPHQGIGGPIRPYQEQRRLFRGGDIEEEEEEEDNTTQEGGALPSNYAFLENLLGPRERIPTGRRDSPTRYGYVLRTGSSVGIAFVPPGSGATFLGQGTTGSFFITTNNSSYPVYEIEVRSQKERDAYRMQIEKVKYQDSDIIRKEDGKRIIYSILEREDIKIEKDSRNRWIVHEHGGDEMTLVEFLKNLREAVDRRLGIRRAGRTSDYDDYGRSDYRRDDYGRGDYGRRLYDDHGRDRRTDVEERLRHSESDTDQALRVRKMLTDLRITQPLSHCVARGLQLLGTQVQGDNGKFHSMACDSKFHLVSEGVDSRGHISEITRDALPKPGEGIDKISGLTVLAQLFYDFVQIKTTTVLRSKDPKDVASYVEFMKRMIKVFDGSDYTGTVDDLLKMNLSSIKDQASVKACGAIKDNAEFKKGTPMGNTVIKVVRRLFGTQIQHAARCGQLLKQLFLIKKGDQDLMIRIHPNVMLKGFPELDRINRNARSILIDYYSKCEGLYKTGLQVLEGRQVQQQQAQQQAQQGRPGQQQAQQQVRQVQQQGRQGQQQGRQAQQQGRQGQQQGRQGQQQGRTSRRVGFQMGSSFTATRKNRSVL